MPGMRLVLNMHSYCDEHMGIVFCSISWKEKQKGTGQKKRAERALMGYVANEMLQHFFLREQGCQSILGHGAVKKVWTQWVRMEGEGSSAKKKEKKHKHTQKSDMMEERNGNEKNSCTTRGLQGLRGSQWATADSQNGLILPLSWPGIRLVLYNRSHWAEQNGTLFASAKSCAPVSATSESVKQKTSTKTLSKIQTNLQKLGLEKSKGSSQKT